MYPRIAPPFLLFLSLFPLASTATAPSPTAPEQRCDLAHCRSLPHDPVCGSDGNTYLNICELQVRQCTDPSVKQDSQGSCKEGKILRGGAGDVAPEPIVSKVVLPAPLAPVEPVKKSEGLDKYFQGEQELPAFLVVAFCVAMVLVCACLVGWCIYFCRHPVKSANQIKIEVEDNDSRDPVHRSPTKPPPSNLPVPAPGTFPAHMSSNSKDCPPANGAGVVLTPPPRAYPGPVPVGQSGPAPLPPPPQPLPPGQAQSHPDPPPLFPPPVPVPEGYTHPTTWGEWGDAMVAHQQPQPHQVAGLRQQQPQQQLTNNFHPPQFAPHSTHAQGQGQPHQQFAGPVAAESLPPHSFFQSTQPQPQFSQPLTQQQQPLPHQAAPVHQVGSNPTTPISVTANDIARAMALHPEGQDAPEPATSWVPVRQFESIPVQPQHPQPQPSLAQWWDPPQDNLPPAPELPTTTKFHFTTGLPSLPPPLSDPPVEQPRPQHLPSPPAPAPYRPPPPPAPEPTEVRVPPATLNLPPSPARPGAPARTTVTAPPPAPPVSPPPPPGRPASPPRSASPPCHISSAKGNPPALFAVGMG